MGIANILLIVFVIALAVLSLWWAFNTIRQIQLQKEFAALTLTSVAKLWKKTQYVPEDARDRESLYLYRDFLAKFDEDTKAQLPLMVKDGNVRCLTRREYDRATHQRDKGPISWLVLVATVVYAICAVAFNLNNLLFGIGLAAIMPVWVMVLAVFVYRFNKDKNNYREQLFKTLQDNCADFLRLTKPYIVVDAYPQKFGKDAKPRYVALGDITDAQIKDVKNFIIRQKQAETEIITRSIDNQREIEQLQRPTPAPTVAEPTAPAVTPTVKDTPTVTAAPTAAPTAPVANTPQLSRAEKAAALNKLLADGIAAESQDHVNPYLPKALSRQEKFDILTKLVHDGVTAEAQRSAKLTAAANAPLEEIKDLPPLPAVGADIPEPDADDFSLDSIGLALDAELAKRRKRA